MQVSFIQSIHQVEPALWDSLWPDDYPFTRHGFFAALEDSGSTRAETGWQPCHALLKQDGHLLGVAPFFLKTHSYGEYVFDWAWADAYAQHQLDYYPKLVNAIPFTPTTGPRMALAASLRQAERVVLLERLQQALHHRLEKLGASGWHSLFPDCASQELLQRLPLVQRTGYQFHWFNQGYQHFDQFLECFSSRKRKNLKKERRQVAEAKLVIHRRNGDELSAEDWRAFYALYQRTYLKRSGHYGYLGPSFFQRLAEAIPDQVLLVSAHSAPNGEMVAGAFYLRDQRQLYGRYWGALEEYNGLHFEACYYQGIDYAIAEGLQRFDPGAQGEHKIQRGFTPIKTCSYHWLADPRFAEAVRDYCEREGHYIEQYIAEARTYLPFRQDHRLPPADALMLNGETP